MDTISTTGNEYYLKVDMAFRRTNGLRTAIIHLMYRPEKNCQFCFHEGSDASWITPWKLWESKTRYFPRDSTISVFCYMAMLKEKRTHRLMSIQSFHVPLFIRLFRPLAGKALIPWKFQLSNSNICAPFAWIPIV